MRRLRAAALGGVLAALIAGAPASAHARELPPQAPDTSCTRLTGPSGIEAARWTAAGAASALSRPGRGRITFLAHDGNELELHFVRPASFDPVRGPIWFVMHGRGRDAGRYAAEAAPHAEKYGALVLAIEFPKDEYRGSNSYTLGVVTRGKPGASAEREGRWREPSDYTYNELERVFEAVRLATGGRQPGYYVFGHSAGAQFTHRLLTFVPCARVLRAVAANAGWYTLPGRDEPYPMPYSLRGTPLGPAQQRALLSAPLVVMLGTADTRGPDEDDGVRGTKAAMAQGPNRLARGRNYYDAGRRLAQQLRAPFHWTLVLVPGAGHDARQVIGPAARILFSPAGDSGCEPADPGEACVIQTRRKP